MLLSRLSRSAPKGKSYIFVQQLPSSPESFIHLDIVYLLDVDKCMVFDPLIQGDTRYSTVQITLHDGKVERSAAFGFAYFFKTSGRLGTCFLWRK